MVALSIDTTANLCAVAVSNRASGEILASISNDIGRGHAEMLMEMIEQCLKRAQKTYSDIDKIITSIGPGSFTGVRVGISAARAIGLGLSKPVVGISNLEACAALALQTTGVGQQPGDKEGSQRAQRVWVILDARRQEVYFQQFDNTEPAGKPMVCKIDELAAVADLKSTDEIIFCGSAAQAFLTDFCKTNGRHEALIAHHQSTAPIEVIAALGLAKRSGKGRPEPLYLRGPDAKKQAGFAIDRIDSQQNKTPS